MLWNLVTGGEYANQKALQTVLKLQVAGKYLKATNNKWYYNIKILCLTILFAVSLFGMLILNSVSAITFQSINMGLHDTEKLTRTEPNKWFEIM